MESIFLRRLAPLVLGFTCSLGLLLADPASAAEPSAAVVTLGTLYESEPYWPYQVELSKAWKPSGHAGDFGWGAGTLGVLLRIDAGNRLRVDFGRFGIYWVPADATDIVERANAVRMGEIEKFGPNLAVALNHRLLDPSGKTLVAYGDDLFIETKRVYVLVFADPADPRFAEIAGATADWVKIPGAVVVLIALEEHVDAHVYKYCHDAGWKGAFLMDKFTAPYSEGYLEPGARVPVVQVLTPEGRLLLESEWSKNLSPKVLSTAAVPAADSVGTAPSEANR